LNELGRILSRNNFALVDDEKFVTTSDLLKKMAPVKDSCCNADGSCNKEEPAANGGGSNMLQLAASAAIGMGVAAAATFMAMSKNR